MLGVLLFDEAANALKVVAIVLIIAGVVCLDVSTRPASQTGVRKQTAELRSDLQLSRPVAKGGSKAPSRVGSGPVGSVTGP